MKIKIHARNIDTKLRVALFAMTEFALARLIPSRRLRNNLSIDDESEKTNNLVYPIAKPDVWFRYSVNKNKIHKLPNNKIKNLYLYLILYPTINIETTNALLLKVRITVKINTK